MSAPLATLLADRLTRVGEDAHPNHIRREQALAMADECIRQMEYARRSQELPDKSGYVVWKTPRPPLSLAPEDWKP